MQVKSIDDLIDEFEVEINKELNDPIKSETGEDILEEEVEGDKSKDGSSKSQDNPSQLTDK